MCLAWQFPALTETFSGVINWTSSSPNVVVKTVSYVWPWYYAKVSYGYLLFFLKEAVIFCYFKRKNQQGRVQTWVEFGRLILFNTKASGLEALAQHFWAPGESHDFAEPGTLFLLYEKSFGIKNDLQDNTTLNSSHYLVLHVNEC